MNTRKLDLNMLWQSYRAALGRKELKTADNRCHAYLQESISKEGMAPATLPVSMRDSQELQHYGVDIFSGAFDEYPAGSWTLSRQPVDLLASLRQHYLNSIIQQLQAVSGSVDPEVYDRAATLVKYLCGLVSSPDNYQTIVNLNITSSVLQIGQHCLQIAMTHDDVATLPAELLTVISFCAIYLHFFYDPNKKWKTQFIQHLSKVPASMINVSSVDEQVSTLFIGLFNIATAVKECSEEMMRLQCEVLHMFGAIMAGSKRNAGVVLNGKTGALLFTLYRGDPTTRYTQLQAVGARVIVRAVVTVHNWKLHNHDQEQQSTVDIHVLLYGILHSLVPNYRKTEANNIPPAGIDVTKMCLLLDTIPMIINFKNYSRPHLQKQLIKSKCFNSIMSAMATVATAYPRPSKEESCSKSIQQLCCSCLKALTAIIKDSQQSKEIFSSVIGYTQLLNAIEKLCPVNQTILEAVKEMVIDGFVKRRPIPICNLDPVIMVCGCFFRLSMSNKLWWLNELVEIIAPCVHNQQKCCLGGLVSHLLSLLAQCQSGKQQLHDVTTKLIELIEVLVSHSISSVEMKSFLRLLGPNNEGQLPTYSHTLQELLLKMALKNTRVFPLHYIDLTAPESVISLRMPLNMKTVSGGFTFHAWVALGPPLSFEASGALKKRMLYHFEAFNGAGFQAFFRNSGKLVVATVTKKGEFINLYLQDCPLAPSKLYSVCIVHTLSQRLWGHSEVCVYIDGKLIRAEKMKGPEIQEYPQGFIGCGPPLKGGTEEDTRLEELLFSCTEDAANHEDDVFEDYTLNISPTLPVKTFSLQKAKEQYGTEGSLRGFFCSACLFSECLSAQMIASITYKGPNDLSLFQPRKPDSLHEVANKLMFYYHAKACHEKECPDLSPLHIPGTTMDADFTAPVYSSWEVKSVLRSLGGAQLLIPLLENTSLPLAGEVDKAGVSLFLKLLLAFLDENNQNLFLLSNGIAMVGALMEEVPAVQLTVDTLGAVQSLLELAESSGHDSFVPNVYRHLIFNFYIWRRADYNVQSGHVQFISTLVKDNLKMCRSDYGVEFMLNMIQCFYSPGCREPSHLESEQQKSIRAALFSNIKLYVQKRIQRDEVKALISATLSIPNCDIQEEILQLILQLLTSGDHSYQLGQSLMLMGTPLLTLLHSKSNLVRQTVTKVMLKLYKSFSHDEGKLSASFKNGTFAAAMVQMLRYQETVSSTILLSVLDMCTGKSLDNYTDYISNLELCMALLQLLRIADVEVKNTICQQLISLLQLNPHHAVQIAKRPAWEMIFLWLLITDDVQVSSPACIGDQKPDNNSDDDVIDGFTVIGLVFSNKEGDKGTEEDDKSRLLNTVVELMGHIVWEESLEVIGTEPLYLKHAWCRLLTAVTNFTDKYQTLFSSRTLMQKLLYFSLHAVHVSCTGHDTGSDVLAVVSIVAELFEYYCTDYSSHIPQFKTTICSIELLECYISLMRTVGLFAGHCDDFQLIRTTLRMLVACLAADNKQYLALGVSRMEELLQCIGSILPFADVCYLLHALFSMLQGIKLTGEDESKHYMILAIRTILIHASNGLDISQLDNLPDASANPNFAQEFSAYTGQEEWSQFIASSVIPASMTYLEEHINPLQESWHTLVTLCKQQLQERDERRLERVSQQNKEYEEQVLDVFFNQRESAREKFAASCAIHNFRKSYFLEQWYITKYSLTGEHGVWNVENKAPRQFTLQIDSTENFSRMRMRLVRDYTTGRHDEASHLRDDGYSDAFMMASDPIEHSLLREARAAKHSGSIASDISELSYIVNDDTLEIASPTKHKSLEGQLDEKKIKSFDCQFITLVDFTPGMLHITTHNLHFVSDNGIEEFKLSLNDIREIHSRRYHLVRSALELFLVDQTNYFFNFSTQKIATKVYSCINSQHTPNLVYSGIIRPHKLLQASGLTNKWVRHQISNFEYIMQLNTLSGRTYNDLNQYPVFPWVLCDYSSETIDLKDPKYYRDLSKPLGVLNPALEPSVRERYDEFDDPSGEIEKFHYGTHYSNAAGVMHYLIRLEPFAKQHIALQSGRFDHADRQFFSIPSTWDSIYNSTSDVKELTPEFYYLPEFLTNINKFDLGKLQNQTSSLEDVVLPKWAKDPFEFIHIHRQALESDYVSAHLHEWVDLIWGYKQRGEEAVKVCNVFYYCTYEGSVDLSSINNEKKKRQLESMINNFGQTPTQLFYEPHPPRLSLQEARKLLAAKFSTSGQNSARSIFENLKELRAFSVEVNNEPLIMVASPTVKLDTIIASGNPERVVTVTKSGLANTHDWLPFSNNKSKSFTFELDHNIHLDKSQWHFIGAPFTSIVPTTHHMFVSSACNKLLVSGGHWDCSFRVHSLEKNKTVRRIIHHTDIVTCVALDKPGERLVTGSCDTTCAVWHFSSQNFGCTKPLQILYGHNSAVICVDVSVELDTVVSGAKDGMCIVHSLREGMHMHTLKPQHENPSKIKHAAISSSSARIVVCYQMLRERRNSRQENSWLCLFSINGQLLKSLDMPQALTALVVTDNHFITSSTEMRLTFGHLHNLKQVASLKMQSPIYSLSLTYQYTHLLVGLSDGKLVIVTCGR